MRRGTTRQINHHPGQGFIQRGVGMTEPADAPPITHGLIQHGTQRKRTVFCRVMVIYMAIARTRQHQRKTCMQSERAQHVIQKADTGINL
jgi:hypothetical protein